MGYTTAELHRAVRKQINTQHPFPLHKETLEIVNAMTALETTILKEWQDDVITGLLRERGFVDLTSCRIRFVTSAMGGVEPVISLRPVIGYETLDTLNLYAQFFAVHADYCNRITAIIMTCLDVNSDCGKPHVNALIALLRVMIVAMGAGVLTQAHLSQFRGFDTTILLSSQEWLNQTTEFNTLIRELELEHLVGDAISSYGQFYHAAESNTVNAFWRYTRKMIDLYPKAKMADDIGRQC